MCCRIIEKQLLEYVIFECVTSFSILTNMVSKITFSLLALVLSEVLWILLLVWDNRFFSFSIVNTHLVEKWKETRCSSVKCSLQCPYWFKTARLILSGETDFRNNYLCIGVKQVIHWEAEITLEAQAHIIK